nr:MAG TPA: hypothetical protein [Caudoviricetes sp.]
MQLWEVKDRPERDGRRPVLGDRRRVRGRGRRQPPTDRGHRTVRRPAPVVVASVPLDEATDRLI